MRTTLLLISLLFYPLISNAQYCIPNRFDTTAFSLNQIDSIYAQYGQNYNWQDPGIQKLYMDVFFPKGSVDTLAKRPLIVMIHGGGFYVGNRGWDTYYCRELAKRGFVAATIDYRIGWDFGFGQHYDTLPPQIVKGGAFGCMGDSISSLKAFYRALQDQKAAIRFLVHYADTLINIDTNNIYVGGSSAGGVSSLGLQYVTQDVFDTDFADLHLKDSLGPLDAATNTLTESFSLAGIFSMWGALPDTSLINSSNSVPTLMMHCTGDSLVPCYSNNYYSCPNYAFGQGSGEISKRLKTLNECYEFNYYDAPFPQNGCHNVYSYDYHIDRFSKFLKRQFCDDCRQITVENQVEISNIVVTTGLSDDYTAENKLSIYPNPAGDNLHIRSSTTIMNVSIYNLTGEVMDIVDIQNNTADILLDKLNSGVYFLIIRLLDDEVVSRKVILNK